MYTCSSKNDMPHSTISKVIRFGSELFSPIIPPLTTSSTTAAINPQDVILNRAATLPLYSSTLNNSNEMFHISFGSMSSKTREDEIPFGNAIAIGPAGYIETVRSPYSNFGDIFFDVTTPDPSFSIECKSDHFSNSNIIHGHENLCEPLTPNANTFAMPSLLDEESSTECVLPPSSAILQSQLDNSSLDYFISNNSFIEEIKSSLSVEQQQYINSGMTNSSSTNPCTTMSPSFTTRSDDLLTPDYSESINILQPDVTTYDEMFENCSSEDESDNCFSILISPSSNYFSLDEEDDDTNTVKSENPIQIVDSNPNTRLKALLCELDKFNNNRNDCSNSLLEDIKNKYISEINDAFIYNNTLPNVENNEGELESLYFAIITAYREANNKLDPDLITLNVNKKVGNSKTRNNTELTKEEKSSFKKRKLISEITEININTKRYKKRSWKKSEKDKIMREYNSKRDYEVKKSRKNYNSDTINLLMDWYLENDGRPPSTEAKQHLSDLTGKTDIQISTWFQNARRRYQNKLENFQFLKSKFPALVYDNQSLKKYMKANM